MFLYVRKLECSGYFYVFRKDSDENYFIIGLICVIEIKIDCKIVYSDFIYFRYECIGRICMN